jgi:lipopolysaccharide transport system permease protein
MNELVIRAGASAQQYWRDVWRYRELFWFLTWRDIAVRYRQTVIGIGWAVIRPLLTMLVFTVVFGRIAGLPSEGVPYALFVFAAMLPWQFFSTAMLDASSSLITNTNIITKIYFPRLIVPASSVLANVVDLLISALLFALLLAWYGVWPDARVLALPLFAAIAFGAALGAGLWLAALNVRYRDVRYVVPFIAQLGLYLSPVGFSSAIVPEQYRLLYSLNPLVAAIDGFRWAILGTAAPRTDTLVAGSVVTLLLLAGGFMYFRRTERGFADVI